MAQWQLTQKNDKTAVLALPSDLRWVDEFDWTDIAQSSPVYSLNGAVHVQQGVKQAGRPVTLSGDWVWFSREQLKTLQAWAAIPKLKMTLHFIEAKHDKHPSTGNITTTTLKQSLNVAFRHHDNPIESEAVYYEAPMSNRDQLTATIKLMTI